MSLEQDTRLRPREIRHSCLVAVRAYLFWQNQGISVLTLQVFICILNRGFWRTPQEIHGSATMFVGAATCNKPLVVGEFGVLVQQSASYDSWLTTTLLEGGGEASELVYNA